jgi:hypothetical protein
MTIATTRRLDSRTIKQMSFYNLCRISDATGYANPVSAIAATHEAVDVTLDAEGNVLTAQLVPACARTYLPIV